MEYSLFPLFLHFLQSPYIQHPLSTTSDTQPRNFSFHFLKYTFSWVLFSLSSSFWSSTFSINIISKSKVQGSASLLLYAVEKFKQILYLSETVGNKLAAEIFELFTLEQ